MRDPIGQTVTVNELPLTVVGVLNTVGASASSSTTNLDDQAVVPITTVANRIFGGSTRTSVQSIYIEATSSNALSAAYQEATAELLRLHGVSAADADFTIQSQQSLLTTATSVDKTLTELLAGIAAISLLVGGIGVMNIMLVSVTERVREIGLRKALGATQRAIRRQFLVEASVLGLAGGVLGAGIGLAGAVVLPAPDQQPDHDLTDGHRRRDHRRGRHRHYLRRLPCHPRRPARPDRRAARRMSNDKDVSAS